ncbi:MAG: efflux RND transporter periplasmic adaptor subunit [bacterium]|nr:efflux RND transporter periplasmic adaptor subunit [bacterium]
MGVLVLGGIGYGLLPLESSALGAGANPAAASPAPIPVETLRLEPQDGFDLMRTYTGELRARRSAELGFEMGGRVTHLAVREGQAVQAGDVLVRLDAEHLETRRAELVASLERARAVLAELEAGPRKEVIDAARATVTALESDRALAERREARRRDLLAREAIAVEMLDVAEAETRTLGARLAGARSRLAELEAGTRREQVDAQRAAVREIEAQIASVDVQLDDSVLVAPFAGQIAARYIEDGAVARVGQAALRLVERERIEAWIGVPEQAPAELAPGAVLALVVGPHTLDATLARTLPELDRATRTATLVLELDPADAPRALPGQLARLSLRSHVAADGFWVPVNSLTEATRGLWSLYVITADDTVARAQVEVLHSDGSRAFVRGTLRTGDRILASGAQRVAPGQHVAPTPRRVD